MQGKLETQVNRVCTDSRQAQAGDLFVPLAGDKFDGHDFFNEVVAKGAAALVVEHARRVLRSVSWVRRIVKIFRRQ